MKISIIIPVYNNEQYLKKCVDSLINQTKKAHEVILINDGSTDSSGMICEQYSKLYSNIIVKHKKNQGLGMARNSGMEIATGDYIGFLDSDDFLEKDFLEVLSLYVKKHDCDMIKSGLRRVEFNGDCRIQRQYQMEEKINNSNGIMGLHERLLGSLPNKHDSVEMGVTGALYRLSIVKEHSILFPSEKEYISEDLIFNLNYIRYSNSIMLIPYVGYNYLVNTNSLTMSYRENRFFLICELYKYVNKLIADFGMSKNAVIRWKKTFFINLWMCISQEKKSISGFKMSQSVINIKKMCEDEIVEDIINHYPIQQLPFRQRVFVILVKYKCSVLLYLMNTIIERE